MVTIGQVIQLFRICSFGLLLLTFCNSCIKRNPVATHEGNTNSNEALPNQPLIIKDTVLIQDLQLQTEKAIDREELISKLKDYTWAKMAKHKRVSFSKEGADSLETFIEYGVNEMFNEGNVTEENIILAKENLDKFVNVLLSDVLWPDDEISAGYGKTEEEDVVVNSSDYNQARAGVCPLYPFC